MSRQKKASNDQMWRVVPTDDGDYAIVNRAGQVAGSNGKPLYGSRTRMRAMCKTLNEMVAKERARMMED